MKRLLVTASLATLLLAPRPGQGADKAGGTNWRGIAQGEAEAAKVGKPALYFFTADWCAPCHTIKKEVFADPKVAAAIEKRYVPVLCEDRFRETGANPVGFDELARRFGLRGLPTLVVSRPGSKKGVRLTGWAGTRATREFLDVAADRLRERESETGKEKPEGEKP